MASGGMEDVLSGIVAAFVAQGVELEQAAILGTYIHSYTADIASESGEIGKLAYGLNACYQRNSKSIKTI